MPGQAANGPRFLGSKGTVSGVISLPGDSAYIDASMIEGMAKAVGGS
jgi:hypothetical protein